MVPEPWLWAEPGVVPTVTDTQPDLWRSGPAAPHGSLEIETQGLRVSGVLGLPAGRASRGAGFSAIRAGGVQGRCTSRQ